MKYQGPFHHIVMIDPEARSLSIYRVFANGERDFLTSVPLPKIDAQKDWDAFAKFACTLGENLLMDSPEARKALNL